MKVQKDTASVVNTLTGEVYDFAWETIDQLRSAYQEIQSMQKAFDRAAKKMNVALTEFLGNEDEFVFTDGAKLKRYYTQRKELRKEDVAKYLDADTMDLVLHVNTTEVKQLFAEMVDKGELPKDAYKEVDENAFVKPGASFIRIIK